MEGPFVIVDHDGSSLHKIQLVLWAVMRTIIILINQILVIPVHMFWMFALRPVCWLKPDLYWKMESFSFHWMLYLVGSWQWSAGYTGTLLVYSY